MKSKKKIISTIAAALQSPWLLAAMMSLVFVGAVLVMTGCDTPGGPGPDIPTHHH